MIAKTLDGIVTAWNDGAAALYGHPAAAMIGTSVERTYPQDVLDFERRRHDEVAHGHAYSGYRCTRLRADGSRVEVIMSLSPIHDARGRVVGVASVSRLPSSEEEAQARFASLLEFAPDAIVSVDAAGRVVMVNAKCCALFGYDHDALVGAEIEVLLPDELRAAHVGHRRDYLLAPVIRPMGGSLVLHGRRSDGSTFPVEVSLGPGPAGGDAIAIAAVRDVSERLALEDAAAENEQRLRQLAENVDVVFLLVQLDPLELLYLSPSCSKLFGQTADEMVARGALQVRLTDPADRDRVERDFMTPARAGLAAKCEFRIRSIDGTLKWVRAEAIPVPGPEGRPGRSVVTVDDVSDEVRAADDLRRAESAARAANDAKNEFLSRMSHELRTPLNAILGFGQLLSRRVTDPKDVEAVGHVLRGGRHLLNLINDVLDITLIESGQISLSLEPVEIASVVDETLRLMEPLADDAGVTLVADSSGLPLVVRADSVRLRQVLLNLVSNAIKYNRPGGSAWITWGISPTGASISVRDDGPGISEDLQHRLFQSFDRLGAERTGIEGTGIGLSLTRSLVALMGGKISVTSIPTRGSTFTVSLPLTDETADKGQLGELARTGHLATSQEAPDVPHTLLYVEDNEPNVRVVEHVLRLRPGWSMIHAALGRLGIDLARAQHPDVVLLDLHLPDITGRDVLVALKSDPGTAAIPVVVVTANAGADQPHRLLSGGAHAFITKPIVVDEFLELLDALHENTGADDL